MSATTAAAETAADAAKKGFWKTHGGNIGTLAAFVAGPLILDRLINGSPAKQQQEAMERQAAFEDTRMAQQQARMGGGYGLGGGMQGLVEPGGQEMSLADLTENEQFLRQLRSYARSRERMASARPAGSEALSNLISVDIPRLRQLQSNQVLDPSYIQSVLG